MSAGRFRVEVAIAVIPAAIGLSVGIGSAVIASRNILTEDNIVKVKDFLLNPLTAGFAAVYLASLIGILSFALFLLVRTGERRIRDTSSVSNGNQASPLIAPENQEEEKLSALERAQLERDRSLSQARFAFSRTRRRMALETDRIQRNSLLNLVIGILFSGIALGILGYPLFTTSEAKVDGWIGLIEKFAPRISVGVLVQLIGFFFLRLYVTGEREVNYIRNELTNWEARSASYFTSIALKDNAALRDTLRQLIRTERNFLLKKGERSLYDTDITYNDLNHLVSEIKPSPKAKPKKRPDPK